jgi:hypothetical protein
VTGASILPFETSLPIPDVSVLELGVIICCVRQPGSEPGAIAAILGRWFKVSMSESDLAGPLRRLAHREWLTRDGSGLHVIEEARERAEFAARGIVHLLFRDRFFFDVAKLLDVAIVREDPSHEN